MVSEASDMKKKQTLFSEVEQQAFGSVAPLAVRMRPVSLEEMVGQAAAVGEGSWLRSAIDHDTLSSVVLFGPAGTGKTSLACVIARATQAEFVEVSAVSGGVSDLRFEIEAAKDRLATYGRRTILFVDEIHRFSRSQQDALLHAVEDRIVILIGATTENPFFEVNSALLSRSRVVELQPLPDADIEMLVVRSLIDERGLAGRFALTQAALDAIVLTAGGDARMALTTLELASDMAQELPKLEEPDEYVGPIGDETHPTITLASVQTVSPRRSLPYDKGGDIHYDVISAFIKSMRGSDPDAAVYWLARMIEGGEDPKFIARRIFVLASEDIGNADPNALLIAQAAFKAAESIGYPECRITLSQAAIYMALAPKSNAAYEAINAALAEVRNGPLREIPAHLRDRHRPGAEEYGAYRYPHSYPGGWVDQRYLPQGLKRGAFFTAGERGWEAYRVDILANDQGYSNNTDV
jgi:putative ATPase